MDTSIFEAFPNAIVSGVWQIGECQHGTIIGNQFNKISDLDVIIDEEANSLVNTTPESLNDTTLFYVRACELPTTSTSQLVSNYMLYNTEEDAYYEIVKAGIGKNQHTGNIEHVELQAVRTEVVNG